jgi:PD-(D/E)XK nuclease superfamily
MKEISDKPLQAALETLAPVLFGKDERTQLIAAKCAGLMTGYDHRWRQAPYFIDSVESVESSTLINPESGMPSRSFTLSGKLDVKAHEEGTGAKVLFDHKTTSEAIEDPNAAYWRQLVVEGQPTHYMLLEWQNGEKVDYGLWDVMRKPQIAPRAVAKKDVDAAIRDGVYFGALLSDDDKDYLREFQRETIGMYISRLTADVCEERPERHFQRRLVPRLDAEVREYAMELWAHSQDLLTTRRSGHWPRNSGACFTYNTPCKFLGLCSGHDNLESGNWAKKDWVHPELPIMQDSRGTEILTNSRIRTFQTCRKKHYLSYELGVDHVDDEEREALYFGNLFHAASEQYFLQLKKEQQTP